MYKRNALFCVTELWTIPYWCTE